MNRFFRSALFPLFVIVLLVYLASQTLIPHKSAGRKTTYSDVINRVQQQPDTICCSSATRRSLSAPRTRRLPR